MSCPSTLIVRITTTLAVVVGFSGLAEQANAQAPEAIPPVLTGDETEDGDRSSEGISSGPCSCDHCASNYLFPRWHEHALPYLQDYFWGHPWNFAAEPTGASVYAHFNTQVGNGMIAKLFLYRYDFHNGFGQNPNKLSQHGQRRLRKLAQLMLRAPAPLRIEESGNAKLDEARRQEVLAQLETLLSVKIDPQKVLVAGLPYPRLHGEEAFIHHGNMLQQTQQGPTAVNSTGTSFGLPAAGSGGSGGGLGGGSSSGGGSGGNG